MKTETTTLPIKMIDIVRHRTWSGLTVAELFHAGRLGRMEASKDNIERIARHMHEPIDLDEHAALMALANEAYEYLIFEASE